MSNDKSILELLYFSSFITAKLLVRFSCIQKKITGRKHFSKNWLRPPLAGGILTGGLSKPRAIHRWIIYSDSSLKGPNKCWRKGQKHFRRNVGSGEHR